MRPAPSMAGWLRRRTARPCVSPPTSGYSARTPSRSCSGRTAWTTTLPRPIKGTTIATLSPASRQALLRLCPERVGATVVPSICGQVTSDFDHQVLKQQPLRVAESIARDTLKMFALTRVTETGDVPLSRWQFQTHYPAYPPYVVIDNGTLVFGTYNRQGVAETIGTGAGLRGGQPGRGAIARRVPARLSARRRLHPRTVVPVRPARRAGRQPRHAAAPRPGRAARRRPGLPALFHHRRRGAAGLRCVRVQLALPASRADHAAPRRGTGHHRRAHPQAASWHGRRVTGREVTGRGVIGCRVCGRG